MREYAGTSPRAPGSAGRSSLCPQLPRSAQQCLASRRPWVNPRGREGDRQRECGRRVSGRGCTSGFSACRQGWEKEGPGDPIIQARGDDGGLMSRGIQVATRDGGI